MGFREVRRQLVDALKNSNFQHEARGQIDTKNLLQAGLVSVDEVLKIVKRCNGTHHETDKHHSAEGIEVHILKRDGWYIKFYCLDPDVMFISVHK